jgi:CelD/BcsL family acetyltransferase involved in cellulose biosynthesis
MSANTLLNPTAQQPQAGGRCTVRVLALLEEILAISSEWQALDQKSTAPMTWFQSFEWCRNWLEIHGEASGSPLIFQLLRGGRTIAIWPMMKHHSRFGVKTLRSLGEPHTQYSNILTENGFLNLEEVNALRQALASLPGVDTAQFANVLANSPLASVLSSHVPLPELADAAVQLDLSSFGSLADYERTLSKKSLRNLKRGARLLSEQAKLDFKVLRPGAPRYREFIDAAIIMKKKWLRERARVGHGLLLPGHDRFLAAMTAVADGTDGPYVFAVLSDGRPVAVEIGYLQRKHYYCYLGAFDWDLRICSPGKVQMHRTIAWLIQHGALTYDLLANAEGYKQDYCSVQTQLCSYAVDLTGKGRIYTRMWTRILEPAIIRIFRSLPDPIRGLLAALRRTEVQLGA